MTANKAKATLIIMILLAGLSNYALADTAATVNPNYPISTRVNAKSGQPQDTDNQSIGWRFFVDKPIVVTHLGLFDKSDDGLSCAHTMGIWRVKKGAEGGLQLERQVDIGPGGVTEGHHVWVALAEPFTINPDPVPGPTGAYERWLVGVWTGTNPSYNYNTEELVLSPLGAVTLNAQQAGVIRLQNYTFKLSQTSFGPPWGETHNDYCGVNFQYSLVGPSAEAGADMSIYTSEQALTTISGMATHSVPGTPMQYRWLEDSTVLQDWADVVDSQANLSLAAPVPAFSIGSHTLTLEVKDAALTVSDTMTLAVANTPPEGQPTPTDQTLEIGVDAILIGASVADFDGDALSYQWVKDGVVLDSGTVTPPAGGAVVEIEGLIIPAGDPLFPLGSNTVQFVVSDGINPALTVPVTVMMQDTTAPTLAPTPSVALLWPPNHQLVPVTIWANGADNAGGSGISLTATVASSETDGDEDAFIDTINNSAGTIELRLRSERSGSSDGRIYTVTITATDGSGNQSPATVEIRVPHDKRKK